MNIAGPKDTEGTEFSNYFALYGKLSHVGRCDAVQFRNKKILDVVYRLYTIYGSTEVSQQSMVYIRGIATNSARLLVNNYLPTKIIERHNAHNYGTPGNTSCGMSYVTPPCVYVDRVSYLLSKPFRGTSIDTAT